MNIQKYIIVQAIKTKDNKLVAIWDDRIKFEKSEMYGNLIILDGKDKYYNVVECIYNIKTRELTPGTEINYYTDLKDLNFKVDMIVFQELNNRFMTETKIVDIIFEEYDLNILKGSHIIKDNMNFGDVIISPNELYAIKYWKPTYLLENGNKISYEHKLYKKTI